MAAHRAAPPPTPGDPPPTVVDGVTVLRWPDQADIRSARADDGLPRVLVIADDAAPPLVWDDLEDWVRHGAAPVELAARTTRLAGRTRAGAADAAAPADRPALDADGIVRGPGGRWASVPPIEARLLTALLDRMDHVVHRADLHRAAWPDGNVNDRALDGRIKLLRRRVAPLGIAIRTVRGLGFLLEVERT